MSEINLLKKKWLFWLMVLEASVHGLLALLEGVTCLMVSRKQRKRKMMESCLLSLFLGKGGPVVSGLQLEFQGTHYRVCKTFLVRC